VSVHLSDFPRSDPGAIDSDLEASMDAVVRCVTLVRAARNRAKIKIKQPLQRARLKLSAGANRELVASLAKHLREEVNVKEVVFESDLSGYVTYEVLPRFDLLGPRLGEKVKALKEALKQIDLVSVTRLESGAPIKVDLDGEEIELAPGDVIVRRTEREGHLFECDGASAIVLDTEITEELLAEGNAREIVSHVQSFRKQSGFDVTDKIRIHVAATGAARRAFETYGEHIKSETLAAGIDFEVPAGANSFEFTLGGEKVTIALERL
jgi:isoleucyl-tRNA synthetase